MMQTQTQISPALEELMRLGARLQAPGPGGQPVPTVAAQMASESTAPTPQGISGLLPGANVAAQRSLQQPVTQAQLQQAMSQQGVAGLRSNMEFADGGVVGYAEGGTPRTYGYAPDYEDARRFGINLSPYDNPSVRAEKIERMKKMREFEAQQQTEGRAEIPTEASQANERAIAAAFSPAAQERRMQEAPQVAGRTAAPPMAASSEGRALAQNINTPPQFDIDPNNPQALNALRRAAMSAGGIERQALMNKIAELESSQASRSMPPSPTGLAALAERPTYDAASIPAAGAPFIKAGEENVERARKAEADRAAFEKTLPDLSAKGIAALQQRMADIDRADQERKERLSLDRVVTQLLGSAQGPGGGARADIQFMATQRAAADAYSQARLGNQQAQLLLEKAQQERQLGRFDRAIALEREASALMEKARDNALKAQKMQQDVETAKFQGNVQMRGQDVTAQTHAADRAAQAALRNLPTYEQQIAEKVMNDWMSKNPGKTLSDAWDYYRSAGRGMDIKETSVELRALKDEEAQLLKRLESTYIPSEKKSIEAKLEELNRRRLVLMGGTPAANKVMTMADVQATAAASKRTVDEVRKAAIAAGYTIQ